MVELDVTFIHTMGTAGSTRGAQKQAKVSRSMNSTRDGTMGSWGHQGTYMQQLHMRPTDDSGTRLAFPNRHEAKEQIRILANEARCHSTVNRTMFIRNLKTAVSYTHLTLPTKA